MIERRDARRCGQRVGLVDVHPEGVLTSEYERRDAGRDRRVGASCRLVDGREAMRELRERDLRAREEHCVVEAGPHGRCGLALVVDIDHDALDGKRRIYRIQQP